MDTTFYRNRLRKIRQRNEVSLAIRRGSTMLTAQKMRIEMVGWAKAQQLQSDAARAASKPVVILGEFDMDIAREDRLTHNGLFIRIVFIQPNRIGGTIAEGVLEE